MMKKFTPLILLVFVSAGLSGQTADIVKFDKLQNIMKQSNDQITVVNFWATWCAPCIKELPYFEAARTKYGDKVEVSLISLDFAEKLEKVNQFIDKRSIGSKVYLLDEIDYNSWIDKVDPSWTGAIPATLIIDQNTGKRKFVEGEMKEEELYSLIDEFLN